jgi:hypothetical protein
MPDPILAFDHTELAEILIKHLGLHEGIWGVYLEFGLTGVNLEVGGPKSNVFAPAAVTLIKRIGIQHLNNPTNLAVDAAKVNPLKMSATRSNSSKKRRV